MTAPVRAALYLRVSTGRQADSDLSIPDHAAKPGPTARHGAGRSLPTTSSPACRPPTTGGPNSSA